MVKEVSLHGHVQDLPIGYKSISISYLKPYLLGIVQGRLFFIDNEKMTFHFGILII